MLEGSRWRRKALGVCGGRDRDGATEREMLGWDKESNGQVMSRLHIRRNKVVKRAVFLRER